MDYCEQKMSQRRIPLRYVGKVPLEGTSEPSETQETTDAKSLLSIFVFWTSTNTVSSTVLAVS